MKESLKRLSVLLLLVAASCLAKGQNTDVEDELDKFYSSKLRQEVEVENPTYRPVIGLSAGFMTFWGDLANKGNTALLGRPAFKVNLSGFMDKMHNFKWNVFWINGEIAGFLEETEGYNFRTQINQYGVSLEYTFASIFKRSKFNPYLSVGFSPINFSPMGYNVATKKYDVNLRKKSAEDNNIKYGENSFTIPIDAGFNYTLHDRIALRVGATYNYSLSDYLDNTSPKNLPALGPTNPANKIKAKSSTDKFLFTYISLNLDLFSDPKTFIRQKYFEQIENEDALTMDQDGDGVFDFDDQCPDTPQGVEVDEKGCPLDKDGDGIPDYLDKDNSTPAGTIVNNKGVAISKDDFTILDNQFSAVKRSDVAIVLSEGGRRYKINKGAMSAKFAGIDKNKDGSISYEELKQTVNDFLDKKSDFTSQDINELYEYFFAQ